MGPSNSDLVIEEIPGNEVNASTRKINLANALGVGEWGRKNWAGDCSIVIGAGFNGGGLRIYPWLRRYVEYLTSVYPKDNLVNTREKEFGFAFFDHQGRTSGGSTVFSIWVNGSFRPVRFRLIRG